MTTGQLIKAARKKAEMTQAELAEKLGVSSSFIAQYETNNRNPKKETLERIAAALDVSYFDLITEKERAIYESGFKEGSGAEEWQNYVIDELWKQEGYSYSDTEVRLINSFSQLNSDGQQKAVERVKELTEIPRYRATLPPESTPPAPEGTDTAPGEKPPERL